MSCQILHQSQICSGNLFCFADKITNLSSDRSQIRLREHCSPLRKNTKFSKTLSIRPNSPPGAMSCQILHQSQFISGIVLSFANKPTNLSSDRSQIRLQEHCSPLRKNTKFSKTLSIRPNSPPGAMSCQILHQSQICSGNLFCFADKITNLSSDRFQIRLQEHRFPSRKHIKFSKTSSIKAMEPATEFKLEKPVVVIDNYDSFTYNLCQYLGSLGCPYVVYRNDELTVEELIEKQPSGILISPGPGTPKDSGISLEIVVKLGLDVPLFGVCMGAQCFGEAFGGKVIRSPHGVVHGKKSLVYYDEHGEDGLLSGLPNPFVAGRYHSLVIDRQTFPSHELEITAWTDDGLIMGVRHKTYRHIQGVQFHPESIITENGMQIMENFLRILQKKASTPK